MIVFLKPKQNGINIAFEKISVWNVLYTIRMYKDGNTITDVIVEASAPGEKTIEYGKNF